MSEDTEHGREIEFDPRSDPAWAAGVDAWPWIERDRACAAKTGACPRCGHHMSVLDETAHATCNCSVAHPGAPDGASGCGANGEIERASERQR